MAPFSTDAVSVATQATTLRAGGKVTALGCLTMLAHEVSLPSVGVDESRVEGLGRRFFAQKVAVVASGNPAEAPGGEAPDVQLASIAGGPDSMIFLKNHVLHFPKAWPDKCNLLVSFSDPSSLPGRFRLLCLDELVLSFWKLAGYAQYLLTSAEAEAQEMAKNTKENSQPNEEALKKLQEVVSHRRALVEAARKLQRNVPLTYILRERAGALLGGF